MALKVIGAGFGRTGTLSLKLALEQLGYDACYHMLEVHKHDGHQAFWRRAARGEPVDWHWVFEGYQASVDWPACNFWREQMVAFPDAKVLLSLRDADAWYRSVMNTIWPSSRHLIHSDNAAERAAGEMAYEVIWNRVFDGRMDDREHVIERFHAHNQSVIDAVPEDRLLVYRPGDGWEPLCAFLDCAVPDTPYPKVNTTEQFQDRLAKR